MIRAEKQRITGCSGDPEEPFGALRSLWGELWMIPAIGIVVATLILVIEHSGLSHAGSKFIASLTYSLMIGFPTALVLNWIGFRYAERFQRAVLIIYASVLIVIATLGCLAGAAVLELTGIIRPDFYWREVRSSLPICLVVTLVVGISATSYETLRHRLQAATLELRTRQVEHERANKLLVQARLSSLESRIHPHFLFNTLNSIASLIPSDPKRAEDTVGKLASLLRFSISTNQNSLVPLAQELKIVRDYLEIEKTRFGKRLTYEVSVPAELDDLKVPPLSLQTLVENCVKHVASQRSHGTTIRIHGAQRSGIYEISVTDDGPGFSLADISPEHGLGNLITRLELLYGEAAQLNVTRVEGKTVVTISVPEGDAK